MTSDKAYDLSQRLAAFYALRPVAVAPGTTPVNSLADITIAGLSIPITAAMLAAAAAYRVCGVVRGVNGGVLAQQAVGISGAAGLAAANCNVDVKIYSGTANTFKAFGEITSLGGRVGTMTNLAAAETFFAEYEGLIVFSAPGTLIITGSCVTLAADTWTAQGQSRMYLTPS